MNCVCCGFAAVMERPEITARGYRRFRCRTCGRQFNERSAGVLNRTCLSSDVIAFVVFCRHRYRLTLRDLSESMALRGIEVSHEAVRDWEAKLLPVMGYRPDRVTTDDHGSYPRAIRTVLGKRVGHRTNAYLNNRIEQDHRGIKGRIRCMRGFKSHEAAHRLCREHGELRDLLRPRRHHNQIVSAFLRRFRFAKGAQVALEIMQNA